MVESDHLARVLGGVVWFLGQALTLGGVGAIPVAVFAGLIALVLFKLYKTTPQAARRRFPALLPLPLLWVGIAVWGNYFWLISPQERNAPWVGQAVSVMLLSFVGYACTMIWWIKGGRAFVVVFILPNLFLALFMSLMAGMAISGTWL